ncbi:MAG: hypothetical protein ACJ72Q_19445 [Nitrososphaeraceae archaeon]
MTRKSTISTSTTKWVVEHTNKQVIRNRFELIRNDVKYMRAIKSKADPPSFDLGICGSEDLINLFMIG